MIRVTRECKPSVGCPLTCVTDSPSQKVHPRRHSQNLELSLTCSFSKLCCLDLILPEEAQATQPGLLESLSGISKIAKEDVKALFLCYNHAHHPSKPHPQRWAIAGMRGKRGKEEKAGVHRGGEEETQDTSEVQ